MSPKKRKSHSYKYNKMERKVFTRWINRKLVSTSHVVGDLQSDLLNRFILISLVEALLCRPLTEIESLGAQATPTDFIDTALSILRHDGVALTDIDAYAIVEGSLQTIMDFVWSLILHYSINKAFNTDKDLTDVTSEEFLNWLNSKFNNYSVKNFCSDWNSGISIGVLVNSCDNDLCIDVNTWDVDNNAKNARFAMEAALQCLDIPQLLKPSEMINDKVTERAMLTYISQFIEPLINASTVKNDPSDKGAISMEDDGCNTSGILAAISTDQPRIEDVEDCIVRIEDEMSLYVNREVRVFVTLTKIYDVTVSDIIMETKGPNKVVIPISGRITSDASEMEFSFTSSLPGVYDLSIFKVISGSIGVEIKTFKVTLMEENKDENLLVYGPGLCKATVGYNGIFILESKGADKQIGFSMEGPSKVEIECLDLGNGTIKFTYLAVYHGDYKLSISVNDAAISNSPYHITVMKSQEITNYSNIQVTESLKLNNATFLIDARQTNIDIYPDIECYNEGGCVVSTIKVVEEEKQVYNFQIEFNELGRFIIFAGFHGIQIAGFPRIIFIPKTPASKEGIKSEEETDIMSLQNKCISILNDQIANAIEISVRLLCEKVLDDSESTVGSNKFDNSPSMSKYRQNNIQYDVSYKWSDHRFGLVLFGSSLNGCPIQCYRSYNVVIDLNSSTCLGELGISIEGPSNTNVQCSDDNNGRCVIQYSPMKPGQYELIVTFNEEPIEGSPFIILVYENSQSLCHSVTPKCQIIEKSQNLCTFSSITGQQQPTINKLEDFTLSSSVRETLDNTASVFHSNLSHIMEPHLQLSLTNSSPTNSFIRDFDDCKSPSSSISSGGSSHSIKSGVYVAKIKRVLCSDITVVPYDSAISHRRLESNDLSTKMEIDRINFNYKESLNSFYGNMLSAFTNLLVMEMMFTSVENISDVILSEHAKSNITGRKKSQDYLRSERSIEEDSHICLESDVSITITDSTTIEDTLEINTPCKGDNILYDREDSKSQGFVIRDTFENCVKNIVYHSQCIDDPLSHHASGFLPKHVADNAHMTLTLMGCRKSVRVDLGSSSMSSNKIAIKDRTIKTSAEIIFDSISQTISKKVTELISVYQNPFNRYLECSKEGSSCCETLDQTSSSLISNDEDSTSSVIDNYLLDHINRSRRFMADCSERGDFNIDSVISCHLIRPPQTRLKNHRDVRVKRHLLRVKKLRVTNFNANYLRCLTEFTHKSIQSNSDINEPSFDKFPNEKTHSVNVLKLNEEEVFSFVEKVEDEWFANVDTEVSPEQNIVKISFASSRFQKIRFKAHPLCTNKDCQTNFSFLDHLEIDDVIFSDALQDFILRMVLDQLVKLHRKNTNLTKDSTMIKCLDREAQTCVESNIFVSTTDVSSTTLNKIDSQNHQGNPVCDRYPANDPTEGQQLQDSKMITSVIESSSNDIKDISSAVETLVDAITDIAKSHIISRPSKNNIKRVEELIGLLPKLIMFGKEKKLHEINYLTDQLEAILLHNNQKGRGSNALNDIIGSIKKCLQMNNETSKRDYNPDFLLKRKEEIEDDNERIVQCCNAENNVGDSLVSEEVHAVGQALERGLVNHDNKFVVYTQCAVPGSLSICIEGPSKAKINFVDQKIGIYIVCYRVSSPGDYFCSITYNLNNIPNSPFKIKVNQTRAQKKTDSTKLYPRNITASNHDDSPVILLPVARNVIFHLRKDSISTLSCFVTSPSGVCGYLPIETTKENDCIIRLFTTHPGFYHLDFFNSLGDRVGDSKILKVTDMHHELGSTTVHCNVDLGNPLTDIQASILAYGEGLSSGKIHCKNVFYLVIRRQNNTEAIIGCSDEDDEDDEGYLLKKDPSLNVTIDGPSKVELSCTDDSVGYTFWYIATTIGTYYISISYSDNRHIVGSPFKATIYS